MKKNSVLFVGAAAMISTHALAQEAVPQANSHWYTDAQSLIQKMVARQSNTNRAKNVILFIADGNGINTNYATRLYDGQEKGGMGDDNVLSYEAFPNLALVKTYNINAQTPDSAPTAGAMNTGVKQVFNTINMNEKVVHDDCSTVEGNKLETFAEMVSQAGKSVGVVSTARITHATPAAVYAKTANRNWEDAVPEGCTAQSDIATQLVDAMKSGVVDVAMGGGRRHFAPENTTLNEDTKGRRTDGKNLIEEAKKAGAQYAWNTETAKQLKLDGSSPILALFEASHMKYEADRSNDDEPSLTAMTKMAIEALQNNEKGYYLQIESGRVDHANHASNAYRAVTDGQQFAQAVAMADKMTNDEDTLIVVTSDHSHSLALNGYCGRGSPILGMCYGIAKGQVEHSDKPVLAADGKPYTVIGYMNGPGSILTEENAYSGARPEITQEEVTGKDYKQQSLIPVKSESHAGSDVAVYAKGPWSHLFDGTVEQNYLFHVMHYAALDAGENAQQSGNAASGSAMPASAASNASGANGN